MIKDFNVKRNRAKEKRNLKVNIANKRLKNATENIIVV
jgi:hypothetical protein